MEIVFNKPRVVAIPGMEAFNDNVTLATAVTKCQLITADADGADPNAANNPRPLGIALEGGAAGETIAYGTAIEVSGFSSTPTPGDLVGASIAVAGGLATGAEKHASSFLGHVTPDGERIKLFII